MTEAQKATVANRIESCVAELLQEHPGPAREMELALIARVLRVLRDRLPPEETRGN